MTSRHVLIIEDDPENREALRTLVELWGHRVDAAADGEAGLQMALDRRPDVIFVDIGLPGLSGYEVAKRIRSAQNGAASYVVALTGSDTPEEVADEACFDAYVLKPADPERLKELLATHRANGCRDAKT